MLTALREPDILLLDRLYSATDSKGKEKAEDLFGCWKKRENSNIRLGKCWEAYLFTGYVQELIGAGEFTVKQFISIKAVVDYPTFIKAPSGNNGFPKRASRQIFKGLAKLKKDKSLSHTLFDFLTFCNEANKCPILFYEKISKERATDLEQHKKNIVEARQLLKDYISDLKTYLDSLPKNKSEIICAADEKKEYEAGKQTVVEPKLDKVDEESGFQIKFPPPLTKEGMLSYYGNETIKVLGRKTEQDKLDEFLICKKRVAWFQLAGVAGQGKSRLAFDLAEKAKEQGWAAGHIEKPGLEELNQHWDEWQPHKPHLIIIDYVIGLTDQIKPIFQKLCSGEKAFQHNVRLLLVERQPWNQGMTWRRPKKASNKNERSFDVASNRAEWFLNLTERVDGDDTIIADCRFASGVEELTKLDEDTLVDIVRDVAAKIPNSQLDCSNEQVRKYIKKQLKDIDKDCRPLYAYFLAEELAAGVNTTGWSHENLLIAALERERLKWWSASFEDRPPLLEEESFAARLALLATMVGGLDCNEAHKKELIPRVDAETRQKALVMTGSALTALDKGIAPSQKIDALEPDLLGEWYILSSFKEGIPIIELIDLAWQYSAEGISSFIQRLSQDFWNHSAVKAIFEHLDWERIELEHLSKISTSLVVYFHENDSSIPGKIMKALTIESESGNSAAKSNLAWCYLRGQGVELDEQRAVELYQQAVDLGEVNAMVNLGMCYTDGTGVEADAQRAARLFQQAVDLGNAQAMFNLGWCYGKGNGVEPDLQRTVQLYQQAVDLGQVDAMVNLGNCYRYGTGVEADRIRAVELYQQAADQGNAQAMYDLGSCYNCGSGVEADRIRALELHQQAADLENAQAMFYLGVNYDNGIDVEPDAQRAVELYQRAADLGYPGAMVALGSLYASGVNVEADPCRAAELYQQAVDLGDTTAIMPLGYCYENGTGVKQDITKAFKLFQQTSKIGVEFFCENFIRCGFVMNLISEKFEECSEDKDWAKIQTNSILKIHSHPTLLKGLGWKVCSSEEAENILLFLHRALRITEQLEILNALSCRHLHIAPLSFYPGYFIADIEFHYLILNEVYMCSLIVGPKGAMPLNGNSDLLYTTNKELLHLETEDASMDYLKFFLQFTYRNGSPFEVLTNLTDIQFNQGVRESSPEPMPDFSVAPRHIEGKFSKEGWQQFEACILYADGFFITRLKLFPDGKVEVIEDKEIAKNLPVPLKNYNGIFRSG